METLTLDTYLEKPIIIGEPDVVGPLAVFPLFGPPARLEYQSFRQAHAGGATVKELAGGASVNDLVVSNPSTLPLLLFEGEEVVGAQQNRTFDVSVLVAGQSALRVPVSCVEAGRWDGSRHGDAFVPAPHATYPSLRRLKSHSVMASVAVGGEARADQGEVWDEVDHRLNSLAAESSTRAVDDAYEARRRELDELTRGCRLRPAQTGALVAIGGEFTVLDRVSQPAVFASLFEPLVQGYALDALGAAHRGEPSVADVEAFLAMVVGQSVVARTGIGMGCEVRLANGHVTGAGLIADDELVQLSAFGGDARPVSTTEPAGRIRRPSTRGL